MMSFTSDQWVIIALIFVLGLLVGGFLLLAALAWRYAPRTPPVAKLESEP